MRVYCTWSKVVRDLTIHVHGSCWIINSSLNILKSLALIFAINEKTYDAPLMNFRACVLVFVLQCLVGECEA